MTQFITISEIENGTRLLRWFQRTFPSMPQREFYRLCRGGQIRVNSSRCSGTEILKTGDVVRIPPTIQSYKQKIQKTENGEKFSLSDLELLRKTIIYNDNDIVVFNKPAGLAVQGGTGIKKSIDKMAVALFPYSKISLVHRLDKETSGLLVVAKTQKAAQRLSSQFQNKTAFKQYLALLNGVIIKNSGVIDNYFTKDGISTDMPQKTSGAVHAITEYKLLGTAAGFLSWVLFSPKTGRTHQLRKHSAYSLNAPIVGDRLYGDKSAKLSDAFESVIDDSKLFLFAYKITFTHPSNGKLITLCAPLPDFMQRVVKFLELQVP
ncbi:MAG: RluA family pseudouridine synthase [Alphaproteobacteria bacterium]|nr:RluA family pseudouridine synthase [Alphaproteobacteria bacterium]